MVSRRKERPFKLEDARRRVLLMAWLFVLLFVGVWGRVLYLQTAGAAKLREHAQSFVAWRRFRWTIYASRGHIKDRSGKILAMDVPSVSILIRPSIVKRPEEVAEALSQITGIPASSIATRIRSAKAPFWLKRGLSGAAMERLQGAVRREKERLQQHPSQTTWSWLHEVDLMEEPHRQYPYGSLACALIGFTDVDEQGRAGVEYILNDMLRAEHGIVEGERGRAGQIVPGTRRVVRRPTNGRDLRLTIDVNIQSIAEECLREVVRKHQPRRACAIVMDVKNGDLLAVANTPSINLNARAQVKANELMESMYNMALMFLFEPGSTFKPVTIAAALEANVVSDHSTFECTGQMRVGKHNIRCVPHGGSRAHGRQFLHDVVARSCNVATVRIGMKLGASRLYEAIQRFGVLNMPADIPGCQKGILKKPWEWETIRLANVSFGQGLMVTPLGLAAAYTAIANDGIYVRPRLLSNTPVETHVALSPETASKMREYLSAVVEEGTGKLAAAQGYQSAGKTGTAQKVLPNVRGYAKGKYVASFVGFAPADEPRIVVAVVVDEPRNGYYGGTVAAPAFREISERVLTYLGVPAHPKEDDRS